MNTAVYERRRLALKEELKARNLPALLVSHAANRYYLSGFELHDPQCNESAGWLVITADGDDFLFTDPRYLDAARQVWNEDAICIYAARKHSEVCAFLKAKGITTMGFEPKALHLFDFDSLNSMLTLIVTENVVESLRLFKDDEEIRRMEEAMRLNHELFKYIEGQLIPGKTEKEIAWEVEKFFREQGAEELAFSTIVGVGPNAAKPHCIPGETLIRENDMVLIDTGCRYLDYNSDQTRTFWVGDTPSDRFKKTMDLVREAQQAAIDIIRPGLPFVEAYKESYAVFQKAGVESLFTHGLGHGVGLETHEPPSLSRGAQGVLDTGMVVTVEPGLYEASWGGIRWEYEILVTEDGCRVL
ncbi:M24 family metallopeptidase [Pseudodesulfovibrio sp. JC047]|uniref:M24 family metallopeptidase n=1 Tax=Pseudodesulfovibrio sp. JC047 TaxID=2683199 RepID=UPI0013D4927F|nr:Xaa-Pro peptidase family protein [Pseudodesulfovibrio sp. JC047]NDV18229.1 M24 family metallopeptidase [Pseudodesulfovibrio sp. JC047]